MQKVIEHRNDNLEQAYLMVVVSIPPIYKIIKDDRSIIKIGNDTSTATIKIDNNQIVISGATVIVKDCYSAFKENIENINNQSSIGKRKIMGNRKCNTPICTCGLCDGFFGPVK